MSIDSRSEGNMETIRNLILNAFDIRKLKKECNFPACERRVSNEIFVYEYTIKRNIDLAMLYLCGEHLPAAKRLIKSIREMMPNKMVQSRVGRIAQG
jgi:hypothetical protein